MSVGAVTSGAGVSAKSMAERISAYNPAQRDAKTVARARSAVIQAFGSALSGGPAGIAKALLRTPGVAPAGGAALVFGTDRRTNSIDAALINATAAAAGSEAVIDAANAAFIVGLFSLCEERLKTGQAFIDALILGAEMSAALAPALPPADGQFGSAMLGVVAAGTRVLELSPAKIAAALLMARIANPGDGRNDQGALSSFIVGVRLKNALLAALLAEAMDEAACAETAGSEGGNTSAALAVADNGTATGALDLLAVRSSPGTDPWDRFERQASAVLPRDQIAPLFERLETIDKVSDLVAVSRLLQASSIQAAPRKVVFAPRGTHEPEETNWVP